LQQPKIQRHSESLLSSQRQKKRKEKEKNTRECHNRGGKEEQSKNKNKNPTPFHRNLSVLLKFLSQHQKKGTAKKNTHAHNNAIIEVEKKDQRGKIIKNPTRFQKKSLRSTQVPFSTAEQKNSKKQNTYTRMPLYQRRNRKENKRKESEGKTARKGKDTRCIRQ
jgi:hypothetical protein